MNTNDSVKSTSVELKDKVLPEQPSLLQLEPPNGWIYLNKVYVDEGYDRFAGQKLPKDDSNLTNFFDGKMQLSFKIALTDSVPRRFYVEDLQRKINQASENNKFRITLLVGPGGEGKSTILQQLAIDLVRQDKSKIHVIFRRNDTASLGKKFIEKLLRFKDENGNSNYTFVFISDNAHTLANDVFKCAETIAFQVTALNNIQFLLASRGTHWQWSERRQEHNWERIDINDDYKVEINRIDAADAKKIVVAWKETDNLPDELKSKTDEELASLFFESAKDVLTAKGNKNSLYRAIFKLRKNRTLESYVKEILKGFDKEPAPKNRTLKSCFAYIVSLHADLGFPLLTKPVLQRALGYNSSELNEVLNLLDDEKNEVLISHSDKFVLARHDVFAEEAKRILEENNSDKFFYEILGDLAVAAERTFRENPIYVGKRENKIWSGLAKWYFDKPEDLELEEPERSHKKLKEKELALFIAETLAKEISEEPVLVSAWAELLRRNGEASKAAKVFCEYLGKTEPDKGYFFEWGVTQGVLKNPFLSVWLTAIALSDKAKKSENDDEPSAMRLGSLATALSKSFEKTVNSRFYGKTDSAIFKKATEATVKLGLDEKAVKNARPSFNSSRARKTLNDALTKVQGNLPDLDLEKCFQTIFDGIYLAWELCESDREKLPECLPQSPLNFNELKEVFESSSERKSSPVTVRVLGSPPKSGTTRKPEYQSDRFPFTCDTGSLEIFDAKGIKPNLREEYLNVLKCFFGTDGEGFKSKLTFSEVATIYRVRVIDDNDEARKEANNFARNLRRQLKDKYGVENEDEIIKSWHGHGFQLGDNLVQGRREKRDALADRDTKPLYKNDQNPAAEKSFDAD